MNLILNIPKKNLYEIIVLLSFPLLLFATKSWITYIDTSLIIDLVLPAGFIALLAFKINDTRHVYYALICIFITMMAEILSLEIVMQSFSALAFEFLILALINRIFFINAK